MTTGSSQNAITVQVPEGFNLRVEFMGAGGRSYTLNNEGVLVPVDVANDQQKLNLAQRALEVGQRLQDGTVAISESLVLPSRIFGGWSHFNSQDGVVERANKGALNGYTDWRRITDGEGEIISKVWNKSLLKIWREARRKFAPSEFEKQGWQDKDRPWFWLASPIDDYGRVRKGGTAYWRIGDWNISLPVPVVRSGLARSLDI